MAGKHVQHMHKALTQMNLQIQHVITDLTGVTGLAIIDAVVQGERNPAELAKLRDPRIKAEPEVIEKSLVGEWQTEHLFTLRQSRRLYEEHQQQIAECDAEIERLVATFEPRVDPEVKPLPPDGKKNRNYAKEEEAESQKAGAAAAFRFADRNLQTVRRGRDADSGLGISGFANLQRDRARHDAMGDGGPIRLLAGTVSRQRYQRGTRAVARAAAGEDTATTHKIAAIFYTMVKNQVEYDPTLWEQRDEQRLQRHTARLKRQAERLGYRLTPIEEAEVA
ncbi:MAG: hypothetical protein ACRD7E_08525 [Bryobacteraceae bacterium]